MNVLVYGSGQLARMMYLAGSPLNINVQAVDVASKKIVNPVTKRSLKLSLDTAIENADVLTVEFEHVPELLLEQAEQSGKLLPNMRSILVGADRVREKQLLALAGIPNCEHEIITDIAQLSGITDRLGDKIIFKSSRDGYDGYGQWRISNADGLTDLAEVFSNLDLVKVPIVAETMCPFDRELSLVGTIGKDGNIALYPLAQNTHFEGQLHVSIAPAPELSDTVIAKAESIFKTLAKQMEYVGTLAVELFQVGDELLVNELAPRVHNSGHWSMQGADTCQFENHLRAICGLPLSDSHAQKISAMVNIIGVSSFSKNLIGIPGVHLHWYGKEVREKRKMGHINVTADSYAQLAAKFEQLSEFLPMQYFPRLLTQANKLAKQS